MNNEIKHLTNGDFQVMDMKRAIESMKKDTSGLQDLYARYLDEAAGQITGYNQAIDDVLKMMGDL